MAEIIETVKTPNEVRQQKIDEVRAIFAEVRESEMAAMRSEFAAIIAEASKPEKKPAETKVERVLESETVNDRGSFDFGAVSDMGDLRYESLPAHMRKVRSQKGDAEIGRWFRAIIKGDRATLMEIDKVARVQLERQYGRTVLTASEGSYAASLMPIPLNSGIISQVNASAVMRNVCSVFQSPNQQYRVPVFGKAASSMVAEGSISSAATGPIPANVLLTKYKNQWVGKATEEAVADSNFNLASALIESAGNAIAYTEDVQICTSQGTAPDFTGSIVAGVTDVSEQTAGTLSFNDFNSLFFSVPKPYRANCAIFVDSVAARLLTGLADTGGFRVMSAPSMAALPATDSGGAPKSIGTIYGAPVYEVPLASGTILVGDPRKYCVLVDPVLIVKQTDAESWSSDTIDFKVTLREDGVLAFADAFRKMLGLTTL